MLRRRRMEEAYKEEDVDVERRRIQEVDVEEEYNENVEEVVGKEIEVFDVKSLTYLSKYSV